QDPEKAKELIGKTAQLEFRMVDDESNFFRTFFQSHPPPKESGIVFTEKEGFPQLEAKDRETLLAYVKGHEPEGRQVLLECVPSTVKKHACDAYRTFLVHKSVPLTGDSLTAADPSQSENGDPEVSITFDAQGGRDFETLTGANVGKRMAIVLDQEVHSAP